MWLDLGNQRQGTGDNLSAPSLIYTLRALFRSATYVQCSQSVLPQLEGSYYRPSDFFPSGLPHLLPIHIPAPAFSEYANKYVSRLLLDWLVTYSSHPHSGHYLRIKTGSDWLVFSSAHQGARPYGPFSRYETGPPKTRHASWVGLRSSHLPESDLLSLIGRFTYILS